MKLSIVSVFGIVAVLKGIQFFCGMISTFKTRPIAKDSKEREFLQALILFFFRDRQFFDGITQIIELPIQGIIGLFANMNMLFAFHSVKQHRQRFRFVNQIMKGLLPC